MRKTTFKEGYSLRVAFLFLVLVFCLFVISASFKIASVIAKGKFDGKHRFTVGVYKGKSFYTLSFSPENQTISLLNVPEEQFPVNKDDSEKDQVKLGGYLAIPVDGFVYYPSNKEEKKPAEDDKADDIIFDTFINYRNVKTRLTIVDLFRLWVYARTIPPRSVTVKDFSKDQDQFMIDKIVSNLFNDYSLSLEKKSINIINGAEVSGLGNRIARMLTNAGANVIAVSTSDKEIKTSEILYSDKKSYTIYKISKVLGIEAISPEEGQGISDITIKLGKDISSY